MNVNCLNITTVKMMITNGCNNLDNDLLHVERTKNNSKELL